MSDFSINYREIKNKLDNLESIEVSKEEVKNEKRQKKVNGLFDAADEGFSDGSNDGKLNKAELQSIFNILQNCDENNDGILSDKELKSIKDSNYYELAKKVETGFGNLKLKDLANFVELLSTKINTAFDVQEQAKAEQLARERKEALDSANEYVAALKPENYSEAEFAKFKNDLEALKGELAKSEPDLNKIAEYKATIKIAIGDISTARAEVAEAERQLQNKRQTNVEARPAQDSSLKAKKAYTDTTNRIGGIAWKNGVGELFEEGKLNIEDYSSATEVLDAILVTDTYKDLNLSDEAKQVLLRDFILNNKSVFNLDGKIHAEVQVSRLELPTAEKIQKAQYDKKATVTPSVATNPLTESGVPITDKNPPKKVENGVPIADKNPPKKVLPPPERLSCSEIKLFYDLKPNYAHSFGVGQFPQYDKKGTLIGIYDSKGNMIIEISRTGLFDEIEYIADYEYDANGKMTRKITRNADGSVDLYNDYEYDANGKMTREIIRNPDGSVDRYYDFKYDANGKETRVITRHSDGSLVEYEDYEYDANGKETREIIRDPDGSVFEYCDHEYDANGKETRQIMRYSDGSVARYYDFEYDANGKYTRMIVRNADGNTY